MYGDILETLEEIIENIEFDDISIEEIKAQLQNLVTKIESQNCEEFDSDFGFDELD